MNATRQGAIFGAVASLVRQVHVDHGLPQFVGQVTFGLRPHLLCVQVLDLESVGRDAISDVDQQGRHRATRLSAPATGIHKAVLRCREARAVVDANTLDVAHRAVED